MSVQSNLSYAAQITISLPGSGEQVTMTVTLWPADVVEVGGVYKLLGECTLADLEQYARELESDVWDTYETIVLPDLEASQQVTVEITLPEDAGELPGGWQALKLNLPIEAVEGDFPDRVAEPPVAEAEAAEVIEAAAVEETIKDKIAEETKMAEIGSGEDAETPDVAVAETEHVYPEIEEEVEADVETEEIVPSRARVRVAGRRLGLNDPTWAAVDILIDEPALRAAQAHALSSLNREVAGVLVGGRPEKQPDGRYVVHVFDTIVAKHTVMQGASVTYTPESWRYLNDTLNERYPDDTAVMVGWYHTHPGFGIFLSGMDQFIHQNFFTQIWHIAYVLDPRARTSGFFCWDRAKSRVERHAFEWPAWAAGSW